MSSITPTDVSVPTSTSTSPLTSGVQTLGKDDFLQLLITKLQNQDPLKPMEDENFIAQLAQFSSLEQMANISDGIAESNQWDYLQMQSINNVMAAGVIGKEVTAAYDSVYFDGESPARISLTTTQYADSLDIVVRDESGAVVATLHEKSVEPGKHTYEWDGRDDFGNRVGEGRYDIQVTADDGNGNTFQPQATLTGVVEAVSYRDGAAFFRVDGMEIPFADVTRIGLPGGDEG